MSTTKRSTMQSKIKIINVTSFTSKLPEILAWVRGEARHGAYRPIVRIEERKVRGVKKTTYCICRAILTTDDQVWAESVSSGAENEDRTLPYVEEVNRSSLHVVTDGRIVPIKVKELQ